MSTVGQIERTTQDRVVTILSGKNALAWRYLGNWKDRHGNSNVEVPILKQILEAKGYEETLIKKAVFELTKAAGDQNKSLYDVNKEVYSMLRYGVKVRPEAGENTQTVHLIDWNNWKKNDFAFAEEVTIEGENSKRPDIVFYINGIAIGVLELKRSTISVSEGIRQNLDNQKETFIRRFFATVQIVMAGNDTEGLRYGAILTPEKYYLTWKEDSSVENLLDRHLWQICNKERLLELLHDFIVFDRGIKKLCRHNQFFGIKAAQDHILHREGGIIWHTQGSGKSLTMVWLAKWIKENINNSRILIITDRDELDKQIEKVFTGVGEKIFRTVPKGGKSGGQILIEKLNDTAPDLLCSLVHKFGRKDEDEVDYDEYINDIRKSLPVDFKAKGDIYVFVDECHRTQSGKLHDAMKILLPNALFIGFTGTPLLKKDKQTSMEVFGKYIHTYKFDEAVKDKVVLDLLYEARDIDQYITSQTKIDQWFERKTKGLNDFQKTELKKRWGTLQKVLSSKSRLEQIVSDVVLDMNTKPRLFTGRGNAMLVSGSIYQACKYYELFQQTELKDKCAIITSYNPNISDIKGESVSDNAVTEKLKQYDIYMKMLNGKDTETFEDEVKSKFIDEPAQMKLLIVVDKLLTGFDAPSATYLYLDKKMQDHALFQAICRVNRLDGDDKEYGYVIDYKDLFKKIEKSIDDYTSEAFANFEKEDVEGLLADRLEKGKERLDEALETIRALCEPVRPPKDQLAYQRFFCGNPENKEDLKEHQQTRIALYKAAVSLLRAYADIANEMDDAGYSQEETEAIKEDVTFYTNLRDEIKIASGETIDLKAYEPDMRYLIDCYIKAEESEVVSSFEDMTLIQLIVERGIEDAVDTLPKRIKENKEAMAETIENNIRRLIIDEMPTNPRYYEQMSVLLEEIIKQRHEDAKNYAKYLEKIAELSRNLKQPEASMSYPKTLDTKAKRALYDNLNKDERLALALNNEIIYTKKDGWKGNKIKEREVRNAIRKHLTEEAEIDRIFGIAKSQPDY
jgi:type I restriction enzyme, R subunit